MINHKGVAYSWQLVYKICGLCKEDFLHDSEGSWEHFIRCLEKWEDKA